MTKNIFLLKGCAALLFVGVVGCQNLEEDPQGFIGPSNFYSTVSQGKSSLGGAMNELWNYWGGYQYGMGNFVFDDQIDDGDLNIPTGFATDLWNRHYSAIKNINSLLGGIKNMDPSEDPVEVDQLIGQAKFLRAWNYFMLVRLFGDLPLVTEETQDAVMGTVTTRTPALQIYNSLIVPDLEDAIFKLPSLAATGGTGEPTLEAAKGMLAKVYITMATAPLNLGIPYYQKAKDLAADLMDDGTVSLIPNVYDVFKQENQYASEMLYSLHSTSDDPNASAQIWGPAEIEGWGDFAIDPVWAENWFTRRGQYTWTPADSANLLTDPIEPRWKAYLFLGNGSTPFWEFGDESEHRPYIGKYLMPYISTDEFDSERPVTNMPILRYADVLLIFAEAENAINGPTQAAYDAINMVRRRAYNMPLNSPASPGTIDLSPALTQAQFDAAVIDERNWELSFEYDRWFDIQRKRLLDDFVANEHPEYGANFSQDDYVFPVPEYDARILNSDGNGQNPGYVTGD